MKFRTFALLAAFAMGNAFPLPAADLNQLVAAAAKYESGQSVEPLQALEQLVRDSASKPAPRAELSNAMIKLLAPGSTFEARRFACQELAALDGDASLPALAGLLNHEETAGIACLALGAQRSPKAAGILRTALPSARGTARLQIINALGNQRDGQSVKPLEALARDADPVLANAAVVALGKIGGAEAHNAVAALRKENKPAIAAAVAESTLRVAEQLAAAGNRQGATALYEEMLASSRPAEIRRGAFAALLGVDADRGEQRILETLHHGDAVLKPLAIAAVGKFEAAAATEKFAAELPKLAPEQQAWMIEALAKRGNAAARAAVRKSVSSPNAMVRSAAVAALGRLNDAGSASLLCTALEKAQSPEERETIADALGQLRGSVADEAIFAGVKSVSGDARRQLITLAGRRGNHSALPVLLEETGSPDPAIARAAFQAAGKIAGAGDVPALLDRLVKVKAPEARPDGEIAATRVMQKLEHPAQRTDAVLAKMGNCPDLESRCSLLRLLPGAGDAKALEALNAALTDKEPAVRDAAVRALAAWPNGAAWEALANICKKPENSTHRTLAFRGLVRTAGESNGKPDPALIERYRQLFTLAGSPGDVKLVLGALAGVASTDALPLALAQLSDVAVRPEAAEAVKKIAAAVKAEHPEVAKEALKRLAEVK